MTIFPASNRIGRSSTLSLQQISAKQHRLMQLCGGLLAFVSFAAFATSIQSASRYQLSGSGTLTLDPPVLKSGELSLKATMTSSDPAKPSVTPMLQGGSFSLSANAVASVGVCYNDTIFRDDFDGDGG